MELFGDLTQLLRSVAPRGVELRPATVGSADTASSWWGSTVQVHMDGDPAGHHVDAANLSGSGLQPGQRVMVAFDPPSGIFVLGAAGGCAEDTIPFGFQNPVAGVTSPPYEFRHDARVQEVVVLQRVANSDVATVVDVNRNGVSVLTVTLPVSTERVSSGPVDLDFLAAGGGDPDTLTVTATSVGDGEGLSVLVRYVTGCAQTGTYAPPEEA